MKRYSKTTKHQFYLMQKFPDFVPRVWARPRVEQLLALASKDPMWRHIVPAARETFVKRDD